MPLEVQSVMASRIPLAISLEFLQLFYGITWYFRFFLLKYLGIWCAFWTIPSAIYSKVSQTIGNSFHFFRHFLKNLCIKFCGICFRSFFERFFGIFLGNKFDDSFRKFLKMPLMVPVAFFKLSSFRNLSKNSFGNFCGNVFFLIELVLWKRLQNLFWQFIWKLF